jgi:hypothetical protein
MDLGVVDDQTDAEAYLLGREFDLLAISRTTSGHIDRYCI